MIALNILITGISSDIGKYLANRFIENEWVVYGTCRKVDDEFHDKIKKHGGKIYFCDFSDHYELDVLVGNIDNDNIVFDLIISSVGTMKPISPFFLSDFSEWRTNIEINTFSQIEFIRRGINGFISSSSSILFWAGAGINGVATNYSAYCISKMILIKMCELLYDENPWLKIATAGPGFIKTKIHKETLDAGKMAGGNLNYVERILEEGEPADISMSRVYDFVIWYLNTSIKAASGRVFLVRDDDFFCKETDLQAKLINSQDMFKMRRTTN